MDIGGGPSQPASQPAPPQNTGGDLLGGFSFDSPQPQVPKSNISNPPSHNQSGGLLDGDFFGGGNTNMVQQPSHTYSEVPKNGGGGFDFLGSSQPAQVKSPTSHSQNSGFSFNDPQPPQNKDTFKFKAYENPQV